jgi:methionine-gamma-lyase
MKFNPAKAIHDLKQFGEFGDVNPSITDSSTYTFLKGETMEETFLGQMEGCFLYSRHWNPSNKYLADALAAMENTESAWITASGMAAITCALAATLQCRRPHHNQCYNLRRNVRFSEKLAAQIQH